MPSLFRPSSRLAAGLLLTMVLAACRRPTSAASPPNATAALERLREDLTLVPAEARLIISLDMDHLRATPAGNRLLAASARALEHLFAEVAEGAGIDLLTQVRRVLVALPGERQEDDRLLVILEVSPLDRARASAWLRSRQTTSSTGFVAGTDRLVIARGAWATLGANRKPTGELPDDAASNQELRRLCERAARQPDLWFAAIVPMSLRQRLFAGSRFPDVAAIARLHGSLGADDGLRAEVAAELSNAPDALLLAQRLRDFLDAAKHHPDLLAEGLSPYLEAVRIAAHGPGVQATLALPPSEAGDLAARLEDLLRRLGRGSLGTPPQR